MTDTILLNEKKLRKGKKFKKEETKGEKFKKNLKKALSKKDQGDILGGRFDKKFEKLAESKEAQLHSKDFLKGVDRAEKRALNEVAQEAGIPMAKGGRVGLKSGSKGCKLAKRGKGRAYGKNS